MEFPQNGAVESGAAVQASSGRVPIYELYGLRVRSELPLDAPVGAGGRFDIDVELMPSRAISSGPDGNDAVVAAYGEPGGEGYSHVATEDGFTLRYFSICEFRVDRRLARVRATLDPGAAPGLAGLLFRGNAVALMLALRNEPVLHASAVESGGAAVAFLGASGSGKSTLAALCCASGGRLVTDDLLRLEWGGDGLQCHPGHPELRLREGAAGLAERLCERPPEKSVDGRFLARCPARATGMTRLEAIVVARPSRGHRELEVRRLRAAQALFYLLGYPRVSGWRLDGALSGQFQEMARIAQAIPVFEVVVPWGPPFPESLAREIFEAVGVEFQPEET